MHMNLQHVPEVLPAGSHLGGPQVAARHWPAAVLPRLRDEPRGRTHAGCTRQVCGITCIEILA